MTGALCSARLRNREQCRSVATHDEFCVYHAALADELGSDVVANGDQMKRRNARQRAPVIAESEPIELSPTPSNSPSAVRPALALTAAEELETIRSVLLEAATSTTRETWATCTCPECSKSFRQEISVPDHGARIKAVETLLREGLGRVGEAEIVEPKVPQSVEELRNLSTAELELMVALGYAAQIRAVVDDGDDALRLEVERWEPEARAAVARALAEVAWTSPRSDIRLTRSAEAAIQRRSWATPDNASWCPRAAPARRGHRDGALVMEG
jgi:hypothetical protein